MRWKCSHRYIDIGYILLFKGILRHGSEMGLWSILDGGGGRLRLLGQPGRDVGQAAEDVVTILTFEVLCGDKTGLHNLGFCPCEAHSTIIIQHPTMCTGSFEYNSEGKIAVNLIY